MSSTMEGVARIDPDGAARRPRTPRTSRSTQALLEAYGWTGAYFVGGVSRRRPGHADALAGGLTRVRVPTGGARARDRRSGGAVRVRGSAAGRWSRGRSAGCAGRPRAAVPRVRRARALHARRSVADLHADSLLWGRDLLERSDRGQVDVPRLIEGNVALQVFAATTKSPRHLNIERNDDRSDDIDARSRIAQRLAARDLAQPARPGAAPWPPGPDAMAGRSDGRLTLIRSRADLADVPGAARARAWPITAGLLAIEGAHALDGDPANVEVVADAGLPDDVAEPLLRQRVRRLGARHREGRADRRPAARWSSAWRRGRCSSTSPTPRPRPSTTSWRSRPGRSSPRTPASAGVADNARNLSRRRTLRGIAETGGLVGIGFWPTACGGDDAAAIARSIRLRHRCRRRRARRARLGLRRRASRCRSTRPGWPSSRRRLLDAGLDEDADRAGHGRQRPAAARGRSRGLTP